MRWLKTTTAVFGHGSVASVWGPGLGWGARPCWLVDTQRVQALPAGPTPHVGAAHLGSGSRGLGPEGTQYSFRHILLVTQGLSSPHASGDLVRGEQQGHLAKGHVAVFRDLHQPRALVGRAGLSDRTAL